MIHFDSDYMCGAHPQVLAALVNSNSEQTPGYGSDSFTEEAKTLIRKACNAPEADVWLFVGGTQTNATVIDGLIAPYMGVIAVESAHINVHEGGAIESAGHKVIALPSHDGKISADDLEEYLRSWHSDDSKWHTVIPGMVYLSQASELGTVYTLAELERIRQICDRYELRLFVDGARLVYALASEECDVTLADMARLCDAFYIGGTKAGLLFGEALVAKPGVLTHFFTMMKLHGAVLAKGRLLGVQFAALMANGLYKQIGENAVRLAMKLKKGFVAKGYAPTVDSPTNQQFFTLPNDLIERLMTIATFEYFGPRGDTHSMVRFVTGWETNDESIDILLSNI